jgi:hypothetical protein
MEKLIISECKKSLLIKAPFNSCEGVNSFNWKNLQTVKLCTENWKTVQAIYAGNLITV